MKKIFRWLFDKLFKEDELVMERWRGKVANKQKLTAEDAKFIFDQAEKLLSDSIDTAAIIVNRTNTLITIIGGLVIGITAYLIDDWTKTHTMDSMHITALIANIYLLIVGVATTKNVQPVPYKPAGSLPSELFDDMFFVDAIPSSERIIRYYVSESQDYQDRIVRNNYRNKKRWGLYRRSLLAFLLSPVIFIVVFLIVDFIHSR